MHKIFHKTAILILLVFLFELVPINLIKAATNERIIHTQDQITLGSEYDTMILNATIEYSEYSDNDEFIAALTEYFAGDTKSAKDKLEQLSITSKNPALFCTLRLIELNKKSGKIDYVKAYAFEKKRDAFKDGKPYADIFPIIEHYASTENEIAILLLSHMYYEGLGVDKNYEASLNLDKKLAEQGDAIAQDNLGDMYRDGYGVEQDYKHAVKWYRKSAEQEYAIAQNNLGVMYENGYGVEQYYKQAVEWYFKAAIQGCKDAKKALKRLKLLGY